MGALKEIPIGAKYNMLTVIEEAERKRSETTGKMVRRFTCKCECGNFCIVRMADMQSGKQKSCGCLGGGAVPKDITGVSKGELTAIKAVGKRAKNFLWEFACSCGNTTTKTRLEFERSVHPSCGCTMRTGTFKVGDSFATNEGYTATITSLKGKRGRCSVVFNGSPAVEVEVTVANVKRGNVSNPFHRSICGVGYFGVGGYVAKIDGKHTEHYKHFNSMIKRCYSPEQIKYAPSYMYVEVHPEMHCYQTFAVWCDKQIGFGNEGWQLDKDLLVRGNSEYSFDNCVFLPPQINTFIKPKRFNEFPLGVDLSNSKTSPYRAQGAWLGENYVIGNFPTVETAFNAYKQDKEKNAKRLAEIWKDQIDPRAYEALMNYQVLITD